ncbi:SAUR-like auxin-responsive protein family [Perilla frutescens var. hirtella]|uniref:SAUR-like auxin-responsive protein family n=1 Tax=Perilla frutescens var. hirtella TaxID=608512 RepID=A0AAD4P297_PERFH|nr:SAUR-like auxin-responsive protein family [Perilla frutescens var. frutescens]KAH6787871.1 SAUR-like auxin-responsive protein family [Perilla frutescens var. hirtella]KAH6823480.1 SAUR-like auxin-responsive protein family [Perilla frutescens var. hirtella]
MKKLMRKLSKVGDSSQYSLLRSQSRAARATESLRKRSGGVPEGHLPVYVGEEMERFVVSAELLNHPIFVMLLNKSAQEYGYEQKGVLRIPCHVFLFERVLEALRIGGAEALHTQELLNSLADEL